MSRSLTYAEMAEALKITPEMFMFGLGQVLVLGLKPS